MPPSEIEDGAHAGVYAWVEEPATVTLAPMPQWLLDQVTSTNGHRRRQVPSQATKAVRDLKAGKGRNNALASLAGTLRHRGVEEEEEILLLLLAQNAKSDDPLPEAEVRTIAHSIASRYAPAEDEPVRNLADGVLERVLSDGEAENVEWLRPRYIPAGMLTLLAGDPSQGKSTLTLDLVARITTGKS